MSEQSLHHADVGAFLDQQRSSGVAKPMWCQMWCDPQAMGQYAEPFSKRLRPKPTTNGVQEQRRCQGPVFCIVRTVEPECLLQLPVWHKDDPLLVAFAAHDHLRRIGSNVADLQVGEFADPQPRHDEQLDHQDRDVLICGQGLVSRLRIGRPGFRMQDGFQGLPVDRARQAPGNPHRDADVGERGGQGAVPICAPGKVRLESDEPPLDGRGLGVQLIAQMAVVGEDVVLRQRLGELVVFGEAREGAQVLGVGPQRVMAYAAFIAAGIDESCVIELGHDGLC